MYHLNRVTALFVTLLLCNSGIVLGGVTPACPITDDQVPSNQFDYIVVGVGAAGSVVASRLSENANNNVLAIEGGGLSCRSIGGTDWASYDYSYDNQGNLVVDTPFTRFDIPSYWQSYAYAPTPYPNWYIYLNGTLTNTKSWAGKYVGGSGLHPLIWIRAQHQDADRWGEVATGWSYNDVLPFYKKSEDYTLSGVPYSPYYHGYSGPISVASTDFGDVSVPLWLQSCVKYLPNNTDFNGAHRVGCGRQVTTRTAEGIRDSAANAYLPQALTRSNFKLLINSEVTKILFRPKQGNVLPRAYAVQYRRNGQTYTVQARKEIILTAGATHSPKYLLLSGIGNATQLQQLGIPVLVNSPNVGLHLTNNQGISGAYEYPGNNYPNGWQVEVAAQEYAINGTGPMAFTGSLGYAYSNSNPNITDYANFYIGGQTSSHYPDAQAASLIDTMATQVNLMHPKMHGRVYLHSADPLDPPAVDINLWAHQEDINTLIYGIRLLRKILSTPPVSTVVGEELIPGPQYQTDAQLTQWIEANGMYSGHWSGSARFGNYANSSVLDPRLRVWGVTGLRVGDNSVLPNMGYHPHATAIMVGERTAAFVLADNA